MEWKDVVECKGCGRVQGRLGVLGCAGVNTQKQACARLPECSSHMAGCQSGAECRSQQLLLASVKAPATLQA